MPLLQRLVDDMKAAMKSGQKDRLAVLRMLINDVKNIDLGAKPITEEQAVESYAKKLRKGIEEYEKLGKSAEAEQFRSELAIVEEYLPKKASPEDTERLVDAFLAQHTFSEQQFGQAMGAFMKQYGQQVDPALVNQFLKKKLAGK